MVSPLSPLIGHDFSELEKRILSQQSHEIMKQMRHVYSHASLAPKMSVSNRGAIRDVTSVLRLKVEVVKNGYVVDVAKGEHDGISAPRPEREIAQNRAEALACLRELFDRELAEIAALLPDIGKE